MVLFEFQAVLDAMADAVIASDASDVVAYLNPAAERLLGWPREELIGRSLTTVMPERMRAAHEVGFHRYMTTGRAKIMGRPVRVPALRRDGCEIDVELTLSTLPLADGRALVIACLRDLRDRVELERQLVAQRRLRAQYDVMVTVAGSSGLEDAGPRLLQAIGEGLGWSTGILWIVAGAELRVGSSWSLVPAANARFLERSTAMSFRAGVGLPGRVWSDGRPAWVSDVQADANFPRAELAAEAAIRGAFAFPLLGLRGVVGVAEFFSERKEEPDEGLLEAVATLGRQVGQFLDRIEVERSLRATMSSLAESEVRFRTLAEATSQIVWTTDPGGERIIDSASWPAFTGQSLDELAARPLEESVHPEDRERVRQSWRHALADQSSLVVDLRLRRADGLYVPMVMRAAPVRNADGSVREWVGTMVDISERRREEEAQRFLAEAGDLLASSLDYGKTLGTVARLAVPRLADWCTVEMVTPGGGSAPLAVAHVDAAKVALAAELNRKYPPDRNAATGVPNVLRTGKAELYREIPGSLIADSARDEEHLRLLRAIGVLHSGIVVPIKTRRGTLGAITLVSAESRRRFDERDLAQAEELARRAALAIDNAMAYEEATAAVRVRDDFLSIASHELRTPLTSLNLQVSGLRRVLGKGESAPEKLARRVAAVERHLERMSKLVNDLLDVSRISSAGVELRLEEVDLAEVIDEVLLRVADELAAAKCALTVEVERPLVGRWDRMRLDQIVTNFLTNAIKYGPGRPIAVLAWSDGDRAQVAVRDEGIGIAVADQPRVFDRFARAVPSEHYGGLGLGLWIVRLFVEAMGGSVRVESELGKGATFTATLPRRR